MSQGEVDYPVKDFFLADKPQKINCELTLDLPLECNWQRIYDSIIMFFEINYSISVTGWDIRTIRTKTGVKMILHWVLKVRSGYILNDIDQTIKGIIRNYGLDTPAGISGTTWSRCN